MIANITVTLCAFEEGHFTTLNTFPLESDYKTAGDLLNHIFRLLNHVAVGDGAKMPTGGKHRSLSGGDVVSIERGGVTQTYLCASFGWNLMSDTELAAWKCLSVHERMMNALRRELNKEVPTDDGSIHWSKITKDDKVIDRSGSYAVVTRSGKRLLAYWTSTEEDKAQRVLKARSVARSPDKRRTNTEKK